MDKAISKLFSILLFISLLAFVETIVFKSGKNVEGQVIERIDRINVSEFAAKTTIQSIAYAIEIYTAVNNGVYPTKEEDLLNAKPSYIIRPFNNKNYEGYIFSLEFYPDGYKIIATPEQCGKIGNKIFIAKSKGIKYKAEELLDTILEESKNLVRSSYELTEKDCGEH